MAWEIIHGDVIEWAQSYIGDKFHALLTDCPYEYGFMGKSWDSSGVSFKPETWAALGDHLYPGAFGMTYAGARTWHRIATAIEDAGFIIHPSIFGYLYPSGFPKATRIDTQIDKEAIVDCPSCNGLGVYVFEDTWEDWSSRTGTLGGSYEEWEKLREGSGDTCNRCDGSGSVKGATREIVGELKATYGYQKDGSRWNKRDHITGPATELAKIWEHHRYGLQALKPALEPIILFQKPYDGKSVDSIVKYGAGSLWIGGARQELERSDGPAIFKFNDKTGPVRKSPEAAGHPVSTYREGIWVSDNFYWPSNFVLSHHPECNDTCVEDCPVSNLGGKTELFFIADWQLDMIEASRVHYCSKPERNEREAGLEQEREFKLEEVSGGGGFTKQYQTAYGARKTERRNPHPTIKPISLNRWLATLLLPPEHYANRRLLNPFAGVMSEAIGGMLAGWEDITMIELDEQNCNLGQARMKWWEETSDKYKTASTTMARKNYTSKKEQMSLTW